MKNRFRAVEMGIFAVVSLIFLNSVYNLFTDGKLLDDGSRKPLAMRKPGAGASTEKTADARAGSSGAVESISGFAPYETKCQTSGETFETSAAKVRILGPFCGLSGRQLATDSSGMKVDPGLSDYKIENTTSRYVATVFSDASSGKFSTDFIPLEMGSNKIMMEFHYKSGKVYPVELTIVRK